MRTRFFERVFIGALLAGAVLGASFTLAQARGGSFTAAERRALLAGELVRRDTARRESGHDMFGGTSWQLVHAPVDEVWETVSDVSTYPRLIPSLDRVRVVERSDERRVVWMHHAMGFAETEYYILVSADEESRRVTFELDRSRPHGDLSAGRGFLELRSYRGDTIVSWGMLADVGGGMIQQLFGPFLNDWMLKPPRCVRDEVEPGHESDCAP